MEIETELETETTDLGPWQRGWIWASGGAGGTKGPDDPLFGPFAKKKRPCFEAMAGRPDLGLRWSPRQAVQREARMRVRMRVDGTDGPRVTSSECKD